MEHNTPETDQRSETRIQAVRMTLEEMQADDKPWQVLLTAIMVLYAREKRRLVVSHSLIARLRELANACESRSMPSAFVYSLFGEDDPKGSEWTSACLGINLPHFDPDWKPWICQFADVLANKLNDENTIRICLTEALSFIPSGQ